MDTSDHPKRIPVEDNYICALGRATYNFAYLESGVVDIGRALNPDFYAQSLTLTAGQMARAFEQLVSGQPASTLDHDKMIALAADFLAQVQTRNELLHGSPYTAEGGEQRLKYRHPERSRDWTRSEILAAATEFERASLAVSAILDPLLERLGGG